MPGPNEREPEEHCWRAGPSEREPGEHCWQARINEREQDAPYGW